MDIFRVMEVVFKEYGGLFYSIGTEIGTQTVVDQIFYFCVACKWSCAFKIFLIIGVSITLFGNQK